MHGANENHRVEDSARNSYDVRLGALETEVAVIRNSFATKDDIQALRAEMHASHERILTLLYDLKLELQTVSAKQREDFQLALAKQREEFYAALAAQRAEFHAALAAQRDDWQSALAKQREDFYTAQARQREDFHTALADTKMDLHRALMGHVWKVYGFASLLLGAVYYIARYVH
ncbi:hypothetical protein GJ699_26990 [Duganella sp. FT80W]|uniref:DUF1640 domain-containing protein n=1 Tax=Duganella guangzhouensis TaxID=2666084 RepID=A0A6I2L5U3_9BURK|nr:hypothetical protein [Duganella guangzhouensis]MRW93645.1 hypothetical protein [Duganella guangzhouensis]